MRRLFLLLLLLSAVSVRAAYVTDKLQVALREAPEANSQTIRLLSSSTPLEVLAREAAFTKVQLGDNSTGWVESQYISNEKPTKARLLELQAKTGDLQRQLAEARRQIEVLRKSDSQAMVTKESAGRDPAFAALDNSIGQLQTAHATKITMPPGSSGEVADRSPLWQLPVAIIMLLLSFIGGIAFKNYLISRP